MTIAVASALGAAVPVAAPAMPDFSRADAELLDLGKRLRAAWARERQIGNEWNNSVPGTPGYKALDADWEAAIQEASQIARKIVDIPATTMAGLKVKVDGIRFCHSDDPFTDESFGDQGTTDVRLVSSLLRDLVAML